MTELQHGPDCSAATEGRAPALVALGANLAGRHGGPAASIEAAIARVAALAPVAARSRMFATPALPAGSGPDYVNAAISVDWPGSTGDLLQALHAIEAAMGRARRARWGPRVVDLDLIGRGAEVAPDAATQAAWRTMDPGAAAQAWPDRLIVPHPRMQERAFVLVPLAEIAPGWVHPQLGLSVVDMLGRLNAAETAAIEPLG